MCEYFLPNHRNPRFLTSGRGVSNVGDDMRWSRCGTTGLWPANQRLAPSSHRCILPSEGVTRITICNDERDNLSSRRGHREIPSRQDMRNMNVTRWKLESHLPYPWGVSCCGICFESKTPHDCMRRGGRLERDGKVTVLA